MSGPLHAGFDLGTTNSASAVFDGERVHIVRSAHGGTLTPSVVRIDARGRVTVGERARRHLDRDAANTHAHFKRLMGTGETLQFGAAGVAKRPQDLAAEVLRSLRTDVQDQTGIAPERAVISVPALFELPQTSATSEAAQLAGFGQVELLQEPIASALAAGWGDDDDTGAWLVYDLGGGTFDVSLLETRDGLLRVVAHDGDNFLGGRDFDASIVDWAAEQIYADLGVRIDRSNPAHARVVNALRHAAEDAKIELSRATESAVSLAQPATVDGVDIDVDVPLERTTLERVCAPVIDRSVEVCEHLLASRGMTADQIARIVLVGGPTAMPYLRGRVHERLGIDLAEGHDPMTLVAQGAALYAATAGLDARPVQAAVPATAGRQLWLQHPPVSSDLSPYVLGKVLAGDAPTPNSVQLRRTDGNWQSPPIAIDSDGAFVTQVQLAPRERNEFAITASDTGGVDVRVHPTSFAIMQGLTITDPPLSRTVGVALANDSVRVFFERGAPLPARRTFTLHTVDSANKGSTADVVRVPLVQGEFENAHLCRLVGTISIGGEALAGSLPADSAVEVTLELDRGGRLTGRARVPQTDQVFEGVAHLIVPDATPDTLQATLIDVQQRVADLRVEAFRSGWQSVIGKLEGVDSLVEGARRDVEAARGGDADAGQRAARNLLGADAALVEADLERAWPELETDAHHEAAFAIDWVSQYGSEAETRMVDDACERMEAARTTRDIREVQRQLRLIRRIGNACFYRAPDAWDWAFEQAASEVDSASDLVAARKLVDRGNAARDRGDRDAVRSATRSLWALLPDDARSRRLSFDSGVR